MQGFEPVYYFLNSYFVGNVGETPICNISSKIIYFLTNKYMPNVNIL